MRSIRSLLVREMFRTLLKPQDKLKGSAEGQRKLMEGLAKWLRIPRDVKVIRFNIDGITLEWIYVSKANKNNVILYLHGGAYASGSANTHRVLVALISRFSGARVILPEYRLAPENTFPSALKDSLFVYRWLINQEIKPSNIIIAGDSAGGGLAAATILSLRDNNEPLPAGLICISPWADLTDGGETRITKAKEDPEFTAKDIRKAALRYAGGEDLNNPLLSPIYGDFHGFPPLLIQVGSEELLLSDSVKMSEEARLAGVDVTLEVWEGMWHVWHIMGSFVPESRKAIKRIGIFACNHFGKE